MELYIGLMSGTSADGIDAALVDFSQPRLNVIATYYMPYEPALRKQIHALCAEGKNEIERLGQMDVILGNAFAQAATQLLYNQSINPSAITAIGSHGQTIRHDSSAATNPFTLQIGDPNTIAAKTGITTVADFRRKDVAIGGHGAPLVPAFHQILFSSPTTDRAIVNIGGIANITILPKNTSTNVIGFDTGPGNVLLDEWIRLHHDTRHDTNGDWGATGKVIPELLAQMLAEPYFQLSAPKSTGRELFNINWLKKQLRSQTPEDVQATLVELTAQSIIDAIKKYLPAGEILVCGGGAHNHFLMQRLAALAKPAFSVDSTNTYGLSPDWVEAVAFAWLAKQTVHRQPGNLPSVTGAARPAILGGIYYC